MNMSGISINLDNITPTESEPIEPTQVGIMAKQYSVLREYEATQLRLLHLFEQL